MASSILHSAHDEKVGALMASAKVRSGESRSGWGGARVGSGRKPSENTLLARNFVGPLQAKQARRKTDEEIAEARRLRGRQRSALIAARKNLERQAMGIKKHQRTTAHEGCCLCCGSHFVATISLAKYCSSACRVRAGNTCPDKAHRLKIKYQTDALFNLKVRMRGTIRHALHGLGFAKAKRTREILGCTYEEFAAHIERQFLKGMTWDNKGDWHIDHIIPLATAKTEEDVIRLNHFTNLRPLWAAENMSKGAQITHLI